MTNQRYIIGSLIHHWRINLAVALGVAAATAVLTGALLIGDSMRASLRHVTLDRLGDIDEILVNDRFFRAKLVTELQSQPEFGSDYKLAEPAIVFPQGTIETRGEQDDTEVARAANILVLGISDTFWNLDSLNAQPVALNDGEVILNQALAADLNVKVGDLITLRLPKELQVNADSPLGSEESTDRVEGIPDLKVAAIIQNKGLGRFALRPNQTTSRNAYVRLDLLQDELDQDDQCNAILVSSKQGDNPPDEDASKRLRSWLKPTLSDLGLEINPVSIQYKPAGATESTVVLKYYSLSSDRMMLDDDSVSVALRAFEKYSPQQVFTYISTALMKVSDSQHIQDGSEGLVETKRTVEDDGEFVPYSIVTGIDSQPVLGPLVNEDNQSPLPVLGDNEVVINQWLADDLKLSVGDWLRLDYFEPETTHGRTVEQYVDLKVSSIVPLTRPRRPFGRRSAEFQERPYLTNDPDLTPVVEGVTDKASIDDWDVPFGMVYQPRGQDDDYWNNHRTTPKAFVSLATSKLLWGSRFGSVTSIRIAATEGIDEQKLSAQLADEINRSGLAMGFTFIAVKRDGIKASSGATPFDALFLSLSFFVIAAALMLIVLLFRLGVEQRSTQLGLLLAVGLNRKHVGKLLLGEAAIVAGIGSLLGVFLGIGYAKLMLLGLTTWWVDAISTAFLEFAWTGRSLVLGFVIGLAMATGTIYWAVRKTKSFSIRGLLAGQATGHSTDTNNNPSRRATIICYALFVVGTLLAVLAAIPSIGSGMGAEGQAGAFVGAGAMVLTGMLMILRWRLRQATNKESSHFGASPLIWLANKNSQRNPGRSTITIGVMASAAFLIVSMSSFQLSPTENGRGGFKLVGFSSMPFYKDLSSPDVQDDVLGDDAALLESGTILSLRYKPGDDASCSNVYQVSQPRVLGVTSRLIAYYDDASHTSFTFAGNAELKDGGSNPWHVLSTDQPHKGTEDDPLPVVIDKNTAMFSLKLFGGIGESFDVTYEDGHTIHFSVAGLLANSVLQGSLLISETDFKQAFPHISGYRYFLVDPGQADGNQVSNFLEDRLGEQGLDLQDADQLLADLLAVQNTYIKAFQSLGALGLLLGTFGLTTVLIRNVFERRAELALLRATGFNSKRISNMILLENLLLLAGGMATGIIAALFAVLPHILFADATPPATDLIIMLLVVLVVGIISGLIAVRYTLRAPVIAALRGD